MENKTATTIRQDKGKGSILEHLERTPIVHLACQKVGVSRATYYRWRKEDPDFARRADKAFGEGCEVMNDMAESQLLAAIKGGNLTGIIFWLKNHHKAYSTRIEVFAKHELNLDLTPEQEETMQQALRLAGLAGKEEDDHEK